MKTLTLLTLLILSQLSFASEEISCKPSDYASTIFEEITVKQLQGSAQVMLQVRGEGIYTAIDLLCSLDRCVGFMNGLPTTGSTVHEGSLLKSVTIKRFRKDSGSFNFNCLE